MLLFLLTLSTFVFAAETKAPAEKAATYYNIGDQLDSRVSEIDSISIPESAVASYVKDGSSCKAGEDKYCEFDFGKFVEVIFNGRTAMAGVDDLFMDSFKVKKFKIRQEFFTDGIFLLNEGKLRFNTAKLTEKQNKSFECTKAANGEDGYCKLSFRNGDIEKAIPDRFKVKGEGWRDLKKLFVEIESVEKQEVIPNERLRIPRLDDKEYKYPYSDITVKINGVEISEYEGKITQIDTIEYDLGKNVAPLAIWTRKTRKLWGFELITGLIVENPLDLKDPTHGKIASEIYKITGDGTVSKQVEKVRNLFIHYLDNGFNIKKGSKTKFFAMVPASFNLKFGLRPTNIDIEIGNKPAKGNGPETNVDFTAEEIANGRQKLKVTADASLNYYPEMLAYAQGLRKEGLKLNSDGSIDQKILTLPEKLDEKASSKEIALKEEEFEYTEGDIHETIKLTDEIGKLENGDYNITVSTGKEREDITEVKRLIITDREGVSQFTMKLFDEVDVGGTKISILNKGTYQALIRFDKEECEIGRACDLSLDFSKKLDNAAGLDVLTPPFARILDNQFLLIPWQEPTDRSLIVITLIPLTDGGKKIERKIEPATPGNIIIRAWIEPTPAYKSKPFEPPYPREYKEGNFYLTQEVEMVKMTFKMDKATQFHILSVIDSNGKESRIESSNLKDKSSAAIDAAKGATASLKEYVATWLGYDKFEGPDKTPAGEYTLRLRICSKVGEKLCAIEDRRPITVKKIITKNVEPEGKFGKVNAKFKGDPNLVVLMTISSSNGGYGKILTSIGDYAKDVLVDGTQIQRMQIDSKVGATISAQVGSTLNFLAWSPTSEGKYETRTIKESGNEDVIFDFTQDGAGGGANEGGSTECQGIRCIVVQGPIDEAGKYSIHEALGSDTDLPKTNSKKFTVPITAGVGKEVYIDMKYMRGGLIRTTTKSRQVDFKLKDWVDNAKKPNFVVKVINLKGDEQFTMRAGMNREELYWGFWPPSKNKGVALDPFFFRVGYGPDLAQYSTLYGDYGQNLKLGDDISLTFFDSSNRIVLFKEFEVGFPHEIVEVDANDFDPSGKWATSGKPSSPSLQVKLKNAPPGLQLSMRLDEIASPSGLSYSYDKSLFTYTDSSTAISEVFPKSGMGDISGKKFYLRIFEEGVEIFKTQVEVDPNKPIYEFDYTKLEINSFKVKIINVPLGAKLSMTLDETDSAKALRKSDFSLQGSDMYSDEFPYSGIIGKDVTLHVFEGGREIYKADLQLSGKIPEIVLNYRNMRQPIVIDTLNAFHVKIINLKGKEKLTMKLFDSETGSTLGNSAFTIKVDGGYSEELAYSGIIGKDVTLKVYEDGREIYSTNLELSGKLPEVTLNYRNMRQPVVSDTLLGFHVKIINLKGTEKLTMKLFDSDTGSTLGNSAFTMKGLEGFSTEMAYLGIIGKDVSLRVYENEREIYSTGLKLSGKLGEIVLNYRNMRQPEVKEKIIPEPAEGQKIITIKGPMPKGIRYEMSYGSEGVTDGDDVVVPLRESLSGSVLDIWVVMTPDGSTADKYRLVSDNTKGLDIKFDYANFGSKIPTFAVKLVNVPSKESLSGIRVMPVMYDGPFQTPIIMESERFAYEGGIDKAAYSPYFMPDHDDMSGVLNFIDGEGNVLFTKDFRIKYQDGYVVLEVDYNEIA